MAALKTIRSKRAGDEIAAPEDENRIYSELCGRWLLHLCLRAHAPTKKLRRMLSDEDVQDLTGLTVEEDGPYSLAGADGKARFSRKELRARVSARLDHLGRTDELNRTVLGYNVFELGRLLGMSAFEQELVALAALMQVVSDFGNAVDGVVANCSDARLVDMLSYLTSCPSEEVRRALASTGLLIQAGLIRIDSDLQSFSSKFRLPEGMANLLLSGRRNAEELIRHFCTALREPDLRLQEFAHVAEADILVGHLRAALDRGLTGVNILIYGRTGVGKTEFARCLAKACGAAGYEVKHTDREGEPIAGSDRFSAYVLAQRLLASRSRALILFDEIEDVFPEEGLLWDLRGRLGKKYGTAGKAWLNRVLETNKVPAIWISNSIDRIDPAYLRRFDLILKFPHPGRRAREAMIRTYFPALADNRPWMERLAKVQGLSPGQLERAARVAQCCAVDNKPADQVAEYVLRTSSRLLGNSRWPAAARYILPFAKEYLSMGIEPDLLIEGLRRLGKGSLCFYGPPGTGKSALARKIGEALDRDVNVKRASDLLSCWIGQTEANIADAFEEAAREGAVLVIDEADSFLSDRRDAVRSWELTQVNELLTQMEAFEGIFVCTTNLIERLDRASLRRFTFKIRFDYLPANRAWALFNDTLQALGRSPVNDAGIESRLAKLSNLTPADFAVAAERISGLGEEPSGERLLRALLDESSMKEDAGRGIGFV